MNNKLILELYVSKFEIGSFHVDVKRCQIREFDSVQTIEPKVMDVLVYLHTHQGNVVSQEDIFYAVWPQAIFNPSSVQRCIAILRKAFGDDAKNPSLIITHSKRGYSLELPKVESKKQLLIIGSAVIVALLLASIYLFMQKQPTNKTEFLTLLPISTGEHNEFSFVVAPNAEHIAFLREQEGGKHIWVKQLKTGIEKRLTKSPADYTSLGWRPDSKGLVFAKRDEKTSSLVIINLDSTVNPEHKTIYTTSDFMISSHKLDWANDHVVYFTEKRRENSDTQLVTVNLISGEKEILNQSVGQDWLLMQALSPNRTHVALGFEAGQNMYRIDLLDLVKNDIQTLVTIENGLSGLSWHPDGKSILLSNRDKLLSVNLAGDTKPIEFKNYKIVRDAVYSADGSEIYMELVNVDVDILNSTRDNPNELVPIIDSSSVDYLPVFSPDSSKFVFESHRFGLKQLFIYESGQARLLFDNPSNHELFGIAWSKDGKEVFTASKNAIFRIDISSGVVSEAPHTYHSFYLREAFRNEDALLVSYRAQNGNGFHVAKFELDTGELSAYQASGARLSCYSMSLDDKDTVYFSNESGVFKLSERNQVETVWESQNKGIIGVTAKENTLFVTVEKENEYTLLEHNLLSGDTREFPLGNKEQKMLINANHDYSQLLFLTEPKRNKTLVKLK
nr:winged helix-turn-helix domain-containing protein [Pseudoalteromonas sp. Of7M-16]